MSKLLISCDDTLFVHGGKYYFKNQEWSDFYNRYLRVFDNLRIAVRCERNDVLKLCRVPIDDSRIEVINIPNFSGPIEYAINYFKIGKSLRNICDGCDAAIVRIPSTIGQRVARHVIRENLPYGVEVVFDAEDGWKSETKLLNRLLWKLIDNEMREICYNADGVSCVTEFFLQRHYYSKKKKSFSAHYSTLDLPKSFFSSPRSFPLGRNFTIANVANQVQFNGRKGFNEIIEAMSILKRRGVIVNAKFAGQDYHNGIAQFKAMALNLGIDKQVEFVGYLTRPDLDKFLSSVDLFVMPTRAEGLPRVIIEAMAKGLPVITTPVSGNPELIPSHFLVNYDNVQVLADRIEELMSNKELYENASEENFSNSLKYESSILEGRRDVFYKQLKKITDF